MLIAYIIILSLLTIIEINRIQSHNNNPFAAAFNNYRGFYYLIGTIIGNAFFLALIFLFIKAMIWVFS